MASWMAHLRIADKLLDDIGNLSQQHFIVGNIAPDSGEPVGGDWNVFTPSTAISHWKQEGLPRSERAEKFKEKHLTSIGRTDAFAFYLGYYTHLLTDYIWSRDIFLPQKEQYAKEFEQDPGFIWRIKRDMYDLDHLYYKEHPDFNAFAVFAAVSVFPNTYLDYFSETAFETKIEYITNFYKSFNGNLDREYPYFTKSDMDSFVETAVSEIRPKLLAALNITAQNCFIYGTGNPAKLQSMRECLAPLGIEIVGLKDTGVTIPDVDEGGNTPLENARIKALTYYKTLNRPVFACDSGLYIDGLTDEEQPGVHVRLVNGKRMNDDEMVTHYAAIAQRLGGKAMARYKNAICLVINENEIYEHFGDDISGDAFCLVDKPHPKRIEGFPLDCISVQIESGEYYYWHDRDNDAGMMFKGFQVFFKKVLASLKGAF
ncbi:MAG: non-canonical purine NTP pyrophosphatase [Eubacteriales bacterium]|nr:non-canonical purine NTP pyrophosphatase [Eubacteriales bacterium]